MAPPAGADEVCAFRKTSTHTEKRTCFIFIKFVLAIVIGAVITHYLLRGDTNATVRELTTPATDIDELIARPNLYEGQDVKVVGKVVGSAGILGFGGYFLQQEGGSKPILVMSRSGVPPIGAALTVSGKFKQALSINSYSYPVILRGF